MQTDAATLATAITPRPTRSTAGEVVVVALALAAIMFAVVGGMEVLLKVKKTPDVLLSRLFWQDEQLTWLIASDPSLGHLLAAVKAGADTNPPTFHLLVRTWAAVVPGPPEVVYRILMLVLVWAGLVMAYAVLRRGFTVLPALIGVLVLWAHPLLLKHALDARFYPALFACGAAIALAAGGRTAGWRRDGLVALSAALLCSLHYFGLFTWVAVLTGELLGGEGTRRQRLRRIAPAAVGPLSLLAFIPFYLGQRNGLSVATWVPPTSSADFIAAGIPGAALAVVLVLWWASALWRYRRRAAPVEAPTPRIPSLRGVAGLSGTLAVPLILVAFSVVVQPAMLDKYALTAILGLSPMIALLVTGMPRALLVALAVLLVGVAGLCLQEQVWGERYPWAVKQRVMIQAARRAAATGVPVVVVSRRDAYMLYYAAPELRGRIYNLDLRPELRARPGDRLAQHLVYETDLAEKVLRHYPMPPLVTLEQAAKLKRVHLVEVDPWDGLSRQLIGRRDAGDEAIEWAPAPRR